MNNTVHTHGLNLLICSHDYSNRLLSYFSAVYSSRARCLLQTGGGVCLRGVQRLPLSESSTATADPTNASQAQASHYSHNGVYQ